MARKAREKSEVDPNSNSNQPYRRHIENMEKTSDRAVGSLGHLGYLTCKNKSIYTSDLLGCDALGCAPLRLGFRFHFVGVLGLCPSLHDNFPKRS